MPVNIDGTDITGATIDGTEVTEITADGDVVFSPPVGPTSVLVPDNNGGLARVDNGTEQWYFNLSGTYTAPSFDNNNVYVGDRTSTNESVRAIDRGTITESWNVSMNDQPRMGPIVKDGSVYISDRNGDILSVDSSNGNQNWSKNIGSLSAFLTYRNGVLFAPNRSGTVYAINASDGTTKWTNTSSQFTDSRRMVAAPYGDGNIYTAFGNFGSDGRVYAIDESSGTLVWQSAQNFGHVPNGPLSVTDNYVLVTVWDTGIFCLDKTNGSTVWQDSAPTGFHLGNIVTDGSVYANGNDGNVYSLNLSDGSVNWSTNITANDNMVPVVQNGVLITQGGNGLTALNASTGEILWTTGTYNVTYTGLTPGYHTEWTLSNRQGINDNAQILTPSDYSAL